MLLIATIGLWEFMADRAGCKVYPKTCNPNPQSTTL